jgi:aminoglycoside 6'-N-acetyltransferase
MSVRCQFHPAKKALQSYCREFAVAKETTIAHFRVMTTRQHPIILRKATLADVELLEHWDEQQHVWESDPNDDWAWSTELAKTPAWREMLIAELGGRPIGFIQIIDPLLEESHYWGDVPANLRAIDIWIGAHDDLGRGYGTVMMRLALERCFGNDHVTAVIIDPLESNTRARRFYERLGFRFMEHRRFGDDHCAVYKITREEWMSIGK